MQCSLHWIHTQTKMFYLEFQHKIVPDRLLKLQLKEYRKTD